MNNDAASRALNRMRTAAIGVWTPIDFVDLGSRDAVDQALHRLAKSGQVRRIARGLYDIPRLNALTDKLTVPDPRAVIDALVRRDQSRMLVDGMTAANDLGLTNAVPAKIVVHTDSRLKSLKLGNQTIMFKPTAPSKLHWAGRPAMRVVQALHWLRDTLPEERDTIARRLRAILADPRHGATITADLKNGLASLPDWMRVFLADVLADAVSLADSA